MLTSLACVAGLLQTVAAVNGGASGNKPFNYTAGSPGSTMGGTPKYALKSSAYQYTDMGAAESNIDFAPDGSLIYTPALTTAGVGYATSKDAGQTWSQVLPGSMQRPQPVFRQFQNRYFMWSTKGPGLAFQYSDDQGQTFSPPLSGGNFDPMIQDWAKMVSGKPVRSQLSNGATEILYFSAPSLISTPIPLQPLGPIQQYIMKSTDRGSTWNVTKGMPTLQPLLSGGACAGLTQSLAGQELIIWGDGFVMKNGTVVYGLRRCQKLSLAFSDDEGDSWRLVDVPGSSLPPFIVGDLTYLFNGNVLVPEPISMDVNGNFYSIWVDPNYVLQFSRSTDSGATWSSPVEIGAPAGLLGMNKTMAYLPTLRQHPTTAGRAVLAYYGSQDGGATYNGFIAETGNINSAKPVFSSIIGNNRTQPLQDNMSKMWDQGYGDPLYDLIEFMDVRYAPANSAFAQDTIVTAFARSMCSGQSQPPQTYPRNTCVPGWDYDAHGMSRWQGVVLTASH